VLVGAALLGIVGALVAIPAAAALVLIAQEIWFPRLDEGRAQHPESAAELG
jgi:predicted PurR-regulated permease PerM